MHLFKRTENGVSANVSIESGLSEVERANNQFEAMGVRSLSSKGSNHFIEYGDGRKVTFEVVSVPDAKPVTAKARECLAYVQRAGRPVPFDDLRRAGFNGNTVNSIEGCVRFRPEPYIKRTPAGYVLTDLGRQELNR